MVVRVGGIRKFTFDVSNKYGTAHSEFRRNQVEFVRLQNLRKMTGKEIGKRGRLTLVFYLRVVIVCRRFSTTYGKAAVKGNLALSLGGEVQGVIHIELILKNQRKRGNFIGHEEHKSTFPSEKRNRQEFATYPLGKYPKSSSSLMSSKQKSNCLAAMGVSDMVSVSGVSLSPRWITYCVAHWPVSFGRTMYCKSS